MFINYIFRICQKTFKNIINYYIVIIVIIFFLFHINSLMLTINDVITIFVTLTCARYLYIKIYHDIYGVYPKFVSESTKQMLSESGRK